MDNLDKKAQTPDFPKYPNGSIFTAYKVTMKQIDSVDFDCIRYKNLLRNNKIVGSKPQVFFSLEDAIEEQNRRLDRSRLLRERKKAEAEAEPQKRLSPREKEILLLYYESKLNDKEIAAIMEIADWRVKELRYRALRKIKIKSAKRSFSDAILAVINAPTNSSNSEHNPTASDARR